MPRFLIYKEQLYLELAEFNEWLQKSKLLTFSPFAEKTPIASKLLNISNFATLKTKIAELHSNNKQVLITGFSEGSGERLITLLSEHDINHVVKIESWAQVKQLSTKTIGLAIIDMEQGFETDDFAIITEQDILGTRIAHHYQKQRRADLFIAEASALAVGDLVVHVDHGIGRYLGLQAINADGAWHDCLCVEYQGGDKLFVPAENLEVLSRYGAEDSGANLDRIGSAAWQSRKAKVKERIQQIADDLLKVAADRQLQEAETFHYPETVFHEFCARFPYVETDDQERAINETLSDFKSGKPMDRLICGDVGFGKTEVALRAAFIATSYGKQVAIIVPTTLLCRQHFQSFSERFQGFNTRVKQISRLINETQKKQIRQELAEGKIDIIIGTHALLSKSISFKNLGLVIIDEEQHFGVVQKERLKQLKHNVHVLTLTATPIPRTLQMALSGVRDMSIIATPPIDRLAVRTFVSQFDGVVIREAILREYYRGGQVFYVCPRIKDLPKLYDQLVELIPEVKITVAHGKMPATQLENVMIDFYDGKYNVLLSTSIIESGIDIPTANTLIVHRADMFGLAQLYQIRGRIGRSKQRAYAYLTLPTDQVINENAQKRLEVMQTLDSLGAGFQLASYDLDIRGSGNLLGEEQSGHIREVGLELYQQMLAEAVAISRGEIDGIKKAADTSWTPNISIGSTILIPDNYVTDLSVRVSLYKRLSATKNRQEIDMLAAELIDRFGPLPAEVENLLAIVEMKQLCRAANIEKLVAGPKGAVITFHKSQFANPVGLVDYIEKQKGAVKLRYDQKLVIAQSWHDEQSRKDGVFDTLKELAEIQQS